VSTPNEYDPYAEYRNVPAVPNPAQPDLVKPQPQPQQQQPHDLTRVDQQQREIAERLAWEQQQREIAERQAWEQQVRQQAWAEAQRQAAWQAQQPQQQPHYAGPVQQVTVNNVVGGSVVNVRAFPHTMHLILTLISCGMWAPIWIIHYVIDIARR